MDLLPENHDIFELWKICHKHGRDGMSGHVKIESALDLCRAVGADTKTLNGILAFESTIRAVWEEKENSKKGPGKEDDEP